MNESIDLLKFLNKNENACNTKKMVDNTCDEMLYTKFLKQVERIPDHIAAITQQEQITYRKLYEDSIKVADMLEKAQVKKASVIAVYMDKGIEQIVAVLGITMYGAIYMPVNTVLPENKVISMLDVGRVECMITDQKNSFFTGMMNKKCFFIEQCLESNDTAFQLDKKREPSELAYIIFTSGSTGTPKGVSIEHIGAVNTINDMIERFQINENDKVLALSSLSFDLSVFDIFGLLSCGGTIILPNAADVQNPSKWFKLIKEYEITIWNSVPALCEILVEYCENKKFNELSGLRLVLLSGDWIPVTLPDRIKNIYPEANVVSLGGATEASIWSVIYPIDKVNKEWSSIPYGKAMKNQSIYILDDELDECPIWVTGKIYIGGIGLAREYINNEIATEERFITNPRTNERLYYTGDLGRYMDDGNIEFIGRDDRQIKMHGYRLELGEIEDALLSIEGVSRAIASVIDKHNDNKYIVAFVIMSAGYEEKVNELKHLLTKKLPVYAIPSYIIKVDHFLLNSNGKVDLKKMQEKLIDDNETVKEEVIKPAAKVNRNSELDVTETKLRNIVSGIIHVEHINKDDSLFVYGLNSVDMIRIINAIEMEFGLRIDINELYEEASISKMCMLINQENSKSENEDTMLNNSLINSLLERFPVIKDPEVRRMYKEEHWGIRRDTEGKQVIQLEKYQNLDNMFSKRESTRKYLDEIISLEKFGGMLSAVNIHEYDRKERYNYASAGATYSIQMYLYIKPDRIEGLDGGIYYYNPKQKSIALCVKQGKINKEAYTPYVNRPIYDEAAFGIYLVCETKAIMPIYGKEALKYAYIEAGEICQVLESVCDNYEIGLCQIGDVEHDMIKAQLGLGETQVLVHSLLGGKKITTDSSDAMQKSQREVFSI